MIGDQAELNQERNQKMGDIFRRDTNDQNNDRFFEEYNSWLNVCVIVDAKMKENNK